MLAVVLAGIALGGLAGSRLLASDPSAHRHAGSVGNWWLGALAAVAYAAFPLAAEPLKSRPGESDPADPRPRDPPHVPHLLPLRPFFSPLSGRAFGKSVPRMGPRRAGSHSGTPWARRLGALAAGFLLLPGPGVERSLFLLAALYGLVAAPLLLRRGVAWRAVALPATAFALALALFPWGEMAARHIPNAAFRWTGGVQASVVAVREGVCETSIAVEVSHLDAPTTAA